MRQYWPVYEEYFHRGLFCTVDYVEIKNQMHIHPSRLVLLESFAISGYQTILTTERVVLISYHSSFAARQKY